MTEPREPTDQLGIGATDMTDNTQPEALRLAESLERRTTSWTEKSFAAVELRRQHARIAELEAQLEAIGAGGVSGPLMGRASLAANAGSEPVAYAVFADNGNIRLWSKAPMPHPDAKPLYLHPSPPEGMVATDAMIDAGKKMLHNSNGRGAREKVERIFNAMIAAVPPTSSADSRKGD